LLSVDRAAPISGLPVIGANVGELARTIEHGFAPAKSRRWTQ
jgi:hypothetical protein